MYNIILILDPTPQQGIPVTENLDMDWPRLVIDKILSKIAEEPETISLLPNFRLVCKEWNDIIEDTPELVNKLIFVVRDPQEFLNLPIVKKRKVRSIKFTKSSHMKPEEEKNFFDAITNTIENVHFGFTDGTPDMAYKLFLSILKKCTNLQELIVNELFTSQWSRSRMLLPKVVTDKVEILAANKIRSFVVNMAIFRQDNAIGLTTLLFKLPKLEEIKLVGCCNDEWLVLIHICKQLIEYLNKFKIGLQLKKLALPSIEYFCDDETYDTLNSLLILCGKNSVMIDGEISYLDLNSLINHPEISGKASSYQHQRPLFKGKVIGRFMFGEKSTFTNAILDLLGELDIRYLKVIFGRDISQGQLRWVGNLRQLEFLALNPFGEIGDHNNDDDNEDEEAEAQVKTLNQDSLKEFHKTFSAGLRTLKTLKVTGDLFSSTNVFQWAQYFPNLTELTMSGVYYTTDDMIAQLTALECLSELYLTRLEKLEDITFTADCVQRYSNAGESSSVSPAAEVVSVPAVACFKSLKYLRLHHCSLLTNNCVINGIAKCKTLEKIKIIRCKSMTKQCLKYLECKSYISRR